MAKREKYRKKIGKKGNNNNESDTETQIRIVKQVNKRNKYNGSNRNSSDE